MKSRVNINPLFNTRILLCHQNLMLYVAGLDNDSHIDWETFKS